MIRHHPDESLLLAHVAGRLDSGSAVVVGAHVEGCAHCRAQVALFASVGGALLESSEPASMAPDALARTFARIDAADAVPPRPVAPPPRPALPAGLPAWPASLAGSAISRWRWLAPGMRWARVTLRADPAANVFLLRIGAGKYLARHTHSGRELTQVLSGTFDDGRAVFGAGDFDAADDAVHHQPVVQEGGECICLAAVQGRLVFDGAIARVLGGLIGM